jgi:hypothetical protein
MIMKSYGANLALCRQAVLSSGGLTANLLFVSWAVIRSLDLLRKSTRLIIMTTFGDIFSSIPLPTETKITPGDPSQRAGVPRPRESIIAFLITNAVITVVGLLVGSRPWLYM